MHWISKNWRTIGAIAATAVGWQFGLPGALGGGFLSGLIASGGDVRIGLTSAITAAAFHAVGGIQFKGMNIGSFNYGKVFAHGVVGGASAKLQGGRFGSGFLSAGFTQGAAQTGVFEALPGNPDTWSGRAAQTAAAAVVGGTAATVGGGKFSNGAVTGAFSYTFGEMARRASQPQGRTLTANEIAEAQNEYGNSIDYSKVRVFGDKWFPLQGTDVAMAPNGNIYWPAAGGCADLTSCSITIDGQSYSTLPTFIHEMGHVMQYQSGINVVLSAGPLQMLHYATFGAYSPYLSAASYARTPSPIGLNVEAQADWHMHHYCQSTGRC